MKVSVIVVTLNEEANIKQCLQSIIKQDISRELYEIIVVDGGSIDATQKNIKDIVVQQEHQHPKIKFIIEHNGSITKCRNIGIKNAQYEYVAFTDADCIVPEDWLKRLRWGYSRHAVGNSALAGVGGANIPNKNATRFQQAIGIAFNSFLGSLGSIQAQQLKKDKKLFSISCSNALYKKNMLEDVEMFSEDLGNQGEDWDIGVKMQKKGYVLYGLHNSFVWHNFRTTPLAFWKNMVFYGEGRMLLTKKHPDFIKLKYMLPLFFIPLFFLFFFVYFSFICLYSLFISYRQKKPALVLDVFLVFLLQHFGYALGELKGLRWFCR